MALNISKKRFWIYMLLTLLGVGGVFWVVGFALPSEYQFKSETIIPRPPDRAWHWFVQTDHWGKRFSTIQIFNKGFSSKGIGSVRHIVFDLPAGGKIDSDVEVTDWVEGTLYADRHLGDTMNGEKIPILNARSRFEFQPAKKNSTLLIFTGKFEVHGLLNKWYAFLVLKPVANEILSKSLPVLKRSIEKTETS